MVRIMLPGLAAVTAMASCVRADVDEDKRSREHEQHRRAPVPRDESPEPAPDPRQLDEATRLGAAMSHANLILIPVVSVAPPTGNGDYLTLDEAFEQRVIEIRERPDDSVNELTITNRSDQPLFVMAGEVILGGKQDRIISKDMIIAPGEVATLPVHCVEQGRWAEEGGSRRTFRPAKALAHTKLRVQTSYAAQHDVWQEVRSKNAVREKVNPTDTYRRVATDEDVKDSIASYRHQFASALAALSADERAEMVGFVVVMNGEIAGVESFASPQLFAKLRDKLLHSYFLQAIDLPPPADPAILRRSPGPEDVRSFLAQAAAAPAVPVLDNEAGATEQAITPETGATRVLDKRKPAEARDRAVYRSVYKK